MMQVRRTRYFFVMHIVMLCIVLAAFTPSFYLRTNFVQPEILAMPQLPPIFYVHGIILTAWYFFLVAQSGLIRFRKVKLHQKTGWLGLALSIAVFISTFTIVRQFPGRMQALAAQLGKTVEDIEPGLAMILWTDIFMGVLFAAFIAIGILKRRKSEVHKRVMLYAGIVFLFAATARFGGIVGDLSGLGVGMLLHFFILLALTASLLVFDKVTRKRVAGTSWACFSAYWAAMVIGNLIGFTETGKRLVLDG